MTLFTSLRMLALRLLKLWRVSGPTRSVPLAACILMACVWVPHGVEAQEVALPVADQWALYDNILAFDRLFSARQDDGLVVAVLYA